MIRDVNKHDEDAFCADFTPGAMTAATLGGVASWAALTSVAVLDGVIASAIQWNKILENHWYNS